MDQHQRDPLQFLGRTDKHYVGDGNGLIFAPPHPLWLERPGFWDGLQLFIHRVQPGFTLGLLDDDGREIALAPVSYDWSPAGIDAVFDARGIGLVEHRCIIGTSAISECTIENQRGGRVVLMFAAWCCVDGDRIADRAAVRAGPAGLALRTRPVHAQRHEDGCVFDVSLRMHPSPESYAVSETQHPRTPEIRPDWMLAPLRPGMRDAARLPPAAGARTLVYGGLFHSVRLEPGEARTFRVAMDVSLADTKAARAPVVDLADDARVASRASWSRFFDDAPRIVCDDPWIERFFAYRWYGLRLNFIGPASEYAHPTCAEGTDFFHDAVSYSAWCHARELRWLRDPTRARGTILTFLDRQRADGWIPGILYAVGQHPTAAYFADWGGSVMAIDEVWPDPGFMHSIYDPLRRHAAHLRQTRDPGGDHLFRVRDPYETGQETMSRYTTVDATADTQHFDYRLDLFGIDITIYAYRLHRALARMAARLGRSGDCHEHDFIADRIADAVRSRMWDADAGLFFDVDPGSGRRTGIRAAVCFYPWMTDITGPEHVAGLERNLFDPATFWTPFPVPSTARSDPTFDADGFWKGVRQHCPWNGRVWPMANSHVADALALQATTHAPHLRERAANFIQRFVRMMFHDGDPARPGSYEHYSPLTGQPCLYRGLDDYQHSWINDLIVRWIAGFRPTNDGFLVDPLPAGLDRMRLDQLPFRGRNVSIRIDGADVSVDFGGRTHRGRVGEILRVDAQ